MPDVESDSDRSEERYSSSDELGEDFDDASSSSSEVGSEDVEVDGDRRDDYYFPDNYFPTGYTICEPSNDIFSISNPDTYGECVKLFYSSNQDRLNQVELLSRQSPSKFLTDPVYDNQGRCELFHAVKMAIEGDTGPLEHTVNSWCLDGSTDSYVSYNSCKRLMSWRCNKLHTTPWSKPDHFGIKPIEYIFLKRSRKTLRIFLTATNTCLKKTKLDLYQESETRISTSKWEQATRQRYKSHLEFLAPIILADFYNLRHLEEELPSFQTSYLKSFCNFYEEYLDIIENHLRIIFEDRWRLYSEMHPFDTIPYNTNVVRLAYLIEDNLMLTLDHEFIHKLLTKSQFPAPKDTANEEIDMILSCLEMLTKRKTTSLTIFIKLLPYFNFDFDWVSEEDIPVRLMDLILHWPNDTYTFLNAIGVTTKQRYHIAPTMRFHLYKLKERLYSKINSEGQYDESVARLHHFMTHCFDDERWNQFILGTFLLTSFTYLIF